MTAKPSEMIIPRSASLISIITVFQEDKMIINRAKLPSALLLATYITIQ